MTFSDKLTLYNDNRSLQARDQAWDPEAALEEALQERDQLLKTNPELHDLQNEIDRLLAHENSFEERMNLLGNLIGQKLNVLYDECRKLEDICHSVGIQAELPITRFKRSLDVKKLKDRCGK